jgi:hypothetical protein
MAVRKLVSLALIHFSAASESVRSTSTTK